MNYKDMYESIKKETVRGVSYSALKSMYPLMTKALYVKLGGTIQRTRFNREEPIVKCILGNNKYEAENLGEPDRDFMVGSLFGDGHIEIVADNPYTRTSQYKTGHCWSQAGYVKAVYEIMRPFSSSIFLRAPTSSLLQDWSIHTATICSEKFNKYRDMFYTYGDKKVKEKDILKLELIDQMSWKSLSHWIMEDGKRRGGKYCFSLCIGICERYTDKRIDAFVKGLSDRFGMTFYWSKEKLSYGIHVLMESSSLVVKNILPYIWPDFYYKFRCLPEECGEVYRSAIWFREWEEGRKFIKHPFISTHTLEEYRGSKDRLFKDRFEKFLFSQTLLRGCFSCPECALDDTGELPYKHFLNRKILKEYIRGKVGGNQYGQ